MSDDRSGGAAAGVTAQVTVFLGPTLPLAEARRELDATYLGPVSQGDVLRAVEAGATVIGIVDGYFARVPAVWHKEILWALHQGVRVFGASSMGALRAAELAPFGMVGVGCIYEGFCAGEYEDDDEVTVIHGDAEAGYLPLCDAMVDLRATFARAVAEQVIDEALGQKLTAAAKALPYAERGYPAVLAAAERPDAANDETNSTALARLRAWLPAHRVQQKRQDALELLRQLRRLVEDGLPPPAVPSFRFEHTDAWEQLSRRSGHRQTTSALDPRTTAPLLDELRLGPRGKYRAALDGALARALAGAEAARHELAVDAELLGETGRAFLLGQGTLTPEAIAAWMAAEQLDAESLTRFLGREAKLYWARTLHAAEILEQLPDQLRASGDLIPLLSRARAKRRFARELAGGGGDSGSSGPAITASTSGAPDSSDISGLGATLGPHERAELLAWFFTERRGQAAPGDADTCAQMLGFESGERLLDALALERRFVERTR